MEDLLEGLRIERVGSQATALRPAPGRPRGRLGRGRLAAFAAGVLLVAAAVASAVATRPLTVQTATATAVGGSGPVPAFTAGGYVRAARLVYVAPKVAGRLSELLVKEGDEVRAGDVIALVETRDLVQQAAEARAGRDLAEATVARLVAGSRPEEIAESKARYESARFVKEKAERELARAQALFDQGILSAQALDLARTELQVGGRNLESARQSLALVEAGPRSEDVRTARAALRAAEARSRTASDHLADASVRAPIAGRVLRKFRNVGDFVSPDVPFLEGYETVAVGSPVVALTDLGAQEVSADINETDIARVSTGQPVEVSPNAFSQLVLRGAVTRVSPRADRNKNTIEVKVTLEKAATVLPYDASVKLSFLDASGRGAASAVQIPGGAVFERGGKRFVFVAAGGRASLREVGVGRSEGGLVAVTSGLSDGEQVVTSGLDRLQDGSRIRHQ